jgi:hypothetical protein
VSRSLEELAADFAAAPDLDIALRVANDTLEIEQRTSLVLLSYDGRRNVIYNRGAELPTGRVSGGVQVSMDHLPATVRNALLKGDRFVEVGDQSYQYAQLLKLPIWSEDSRLFFKGMVVDNALAAVVAACDERRWVIGKRLDRLEAIGVLFSLAFARLYERDARFEAVSALHKITQKLHDEHARKVAELEREIMRLRTARGDAIDRKRAEQLEAAAANAKRRAATAEHRLAAVEHQVANAVALLEQAHIQIHQQDEKLREQAELIERLETQLAQFTSLSVTP